MFTGIVQGAYPVTDLQRKDGLLSFTVDVPVALTAGVEIGASIAINGVCLTVTDCTETRVQFDVMQQSLDVTTLGELAIADTVNVERSMQAHTEVGGHILSGHIDTTATVVEIQRPDNNFILTLQIPQQWRKYIFVKGFLGVHGCSLTVAEFNKVTGHATFYLIPETLRKTNFAALEVGNTLNIEVDRSTQAMVDTVQDFLLELVKNKQLTAEALQQLTAGQD